MSVGEICQIPEDREWQGVHYNGISINVPQSQIEIDKPTKSLSYNIEDVMSEHHWIGCEQASNPLARQKSYNSVVGYSMKNILVCLTHAFVCIEYPTSRNVFNLCQCFSKYRWKFGSLIVTLNFFNIFSIMRMQEAGLIQKWKQKWWPSADKCSGSGRTSSATTLGLDSLAGPFFVYISVTSIAIVSLIIETVWSSKRVEDFRAKLRLKFKPQIVEKQTKSH